VEVVGIEPTSFILPIIYQQLTILFITYQPLDVKML